MTAPRDEALWRQFKREARHFDHMPYWEGEAYTIYASRPQSNGSRLLVAHEPDELWAKFQVAEKSDKLEKLRED